MPATTNATATPASHHTAWRLTAADEAAIMSIADALRTQNGVRFPTRAMALRYALAATSTALATTGRLPLVTSA